MDEQGLAGWKASIEAAVTRALRDIVSTFPFEPDTHTLGPPASQAELAALRSRLPWIPEDLVAVCGSVGEVVLPDIANGLFMFEPDYILNMPDHDDGRPDRIGWPFEREVDVVVFGSDGGGTLYAVAAGATGRVFRLRECSYLAGVYEGVLNVDVTVVAESLDDFLGRLLHAVTVFADDGGIADL
ncbi:SMI1/KNR4 family protein [Dactylosporangium sp. NPDC049742]|uniref:SMI1/KNR4 family protein n=1 Tax=Dactylosporangium sp. NPDC049742 TaxID=3154737 RepID=UPI003446B3F4